MQKEYLEIQYALGSQRFRIAKNEIAEFVPNHLIDWVESPEKDKFVFAFASKKNHPSDVFIVVDWLGISENSPRNFISQNPTFLMPKQHKAHPLILLPCFDVGLDSKLGLKIININNILQKLFSSKV